jgi:hypothetical protein
MKITKSDLKQIIMEEIEQIQLQDLQPQVDAMVDVVTKELEQVPEDVRGIVLQAVVAQLADASKDGLQEKKKYKDSFYKAKEKRADKLIDKGVPEDAAYGVADKQMAKAGKKKKKK